MDEWKEKLLVFVGAFFVTAILYFLFAFPVMWLWNWLMPTIFGLPVIGVLQAWGLMVLSGLLLKSTSTTKA
jgi:hypothetical protein